MEPETHNDIDDLITDDDSSSGLSLSTDEGTSHEGHSDIDEHIIDIITDDDYSSGLSSMSADEGTSDESEETIESRESSSFSTSGCESCDSPWNSMELVVTLVQIVAALVVLTVAKDEHPPAVLLAWLIGYTCGCITSALLILSFRFRKYSQVGEFSRTRKDEVMEALKIGIECFFVVWLVLGIIWICDGHSSPTIAPKLYRLCIVFIAFGCIRHAYAILLCAGSVGKGRGGGFLVTGLSHDDCCSICLGKYGEEEGLVRKLECSHVFHMECIDRWLRVKATCPLCQSLVSG